MQAEHAAAAALEESLGAGGEGGGASGETKHREDSEYKRKSKRISIFIILCCFVP